MLCLQRSSILLSLFGDVGVHTTPMHRITRCVLLAAPLLMSCAGDVEAPIGPPEGSSAVPVGARCEPGPPAATPLRPPDQASVENSLRELLGATSPRSALARVEQVAPQIEASQRRHDKLSPFASMTRASDAHSRSTFRSPRSGRASPPNRSIPPSPLPRRRTPDDCIGGFSRSSPPAPTVDRPEEEIDFLAGLRGQQGSAGDRVS